MQMQWFAAVSACVFIAGCGADTTGRHADFWAVQFLSTALGLAFWGAILGLVFWLRYRRRWYYWRSGRAVGTFTAYQMNQLIKTGKISPKTPIRQVRDRDWHLGVAVEDPPVRIWRGLRSGIYAGLLGFLLGCVAFGENMGYQRIFWPPTEEHVREEMIRTSIRESVRLERANEIAGNLAGLAQGAPGIEKRLNQIAEDARRYVDKLERMRMRIILSTLFFGLAGVAGGAATAKGRVKIYKERRVIFKKPPQAAPSETNIQEHDPKRDSPPKAVPETGKKPGPPPITAANSKMRQRNGKTERLPLVRAPRSVFLRGMIGWLIAGSTYKLMHSFHEVSTLSDTVGNFFMCWVAPYFFGALWSEIHIICLAANISAVAFVLIVCVPVMQSRGAAKFAVSTVLSLSLFTLWLEPWLTFTGLVSTALTMLAGLATFWVNIFVTVAWCIAWARVFHQIDVEMKKASSS